MRFEIKTFQNMASVGETDNISGNWQEKQSYF